MNEQSLRIRKPVAAEAIEPILWNDWHVVGEVEQLKRRGHLRTCLLGTPLTIVHDGSDLRATSDDGRQIHLRSKYGYVWACLGSPSSDILAFTECDEPDRWVVTAGSIAVAVSGLRAVENFLDMGHFAFVHTNYLGVEPHTEIKSYKVEKRPEGGLLATDCKVYQPLASPIAVEGFDVDYVYAVLRPYTVLLYKANPAQPTRSDMIVLFVQPVTEESCVAHMLLVYIKEGLDELGLRQFAQLIFGQDKPILENQVPKRLPLTAGREFAVKADAMSAAYRRWLGESGVRFGAIPAN
jgi:phenylpropionate dioxygenase-like ring-hydroxylating dioxygenase large terminal subunit